MLSAGWGGTTPQQGCCRSLFLEEFGVRPGAFPSGSFMSPLLYIWFRSPGPVSSHRLSAGTWTSCGLPRRPVLAFSYGGSRGAAGLSQSGPWGPSPEVAVRLKKCSSAWRTEPPGSPAFHSRGTARCLPGRRVFSVFHPGDSEKGRSTGQQRCLWATPSSVKTNRKWMPRTRVTWDAHFPSWVSRR